MKKQYEAPELILVGEAHKVVLGTLVGGPDLDGDSAFDFEFEQD